MAQETQKAIAIPEPVNDVDSLWRTCQALKEAVEVMQGIRGNRECALKTDLTTTTTTTDGGGIDSVVEDTTPQLGGDLDGNGYNISNVLSVSANGVIASIGGVVHASFLGTLDSTFTYGLVTYYNEGTDTKVYLEANDGSEEGLLIAGFPYVSLGNYKFNADQTVGAGQDDYALTYDHSTGEISLGVAPAGADGADGADAVTVSLSATSQIFSYDNSTGTPALIGPSSITFTLNRQNVVGSTTWAMEDAASGDQSGKLTSTSDTSATLTEANFASITSNSWVKITATADGISDEITVVELQSGENGSLSYLASVYLRKASAPSTPAVNDGSYDFDTQTLTAPSISGGSADDWSTTVPTSDGNPLYISQGLFEVGAAGGTDTTVTWTSPTTLASDGVDGSAGGDGNSVFYASQFIRSASAPSTPTGGSYNFTTQTLTPSSGWSATYPATDGNPAYVSTAIAEIAGTSGTDSTLSWSTPAELVTDGVTPVSHYLTNESHVVSADSDGTNYSLTAAGGTHKVFSGVTDVTTSATHSVSGTATKNGLTMSVVSGTGVYSLSGASWTSDTETFTLRAAYGGVNYDKEYTIAKAKGGTTSARVELNNANLQDSSLTPTDSEVLYRITSTGLVQKKEGVGGSFSTIGNWLLTGTASQYEVEFVVDSGQAINSSGSAATSSWLPCDSTVYWGIIDAGPAGGALTNSCTVTIRDALTTTELDSATITMSVEEGA